MDNKYWTAFGSLFFLLHQDKLLWLLNAPVIGRWFRYVLRISGDSSSVGSLKIDRILPHAIFWWYGDKQVAEFRTHAKFSKRLYYAFAPLWWALHAWDWAVADRWVPRWSFQFSTLTAYPDADPETNTVDGIVVQEYATYSGVSWATIYGLLSGSDAFDAVATETVGWIWADLEGRDNLWIGLGRSAFLYDTSSLSSAASISSAVESLASYLSGTTKYNSFGSNPSIDIYTCNPASNTSLVAGDFDTFNSTSQTGSPKAYADWSNSDGVYNAFTLDATGISGINKTGITKHAVRNVWDATNSPPAWVESAYCMFRSYYADQTGTANDPKLVVTYTLISAAVTGTATASITEADIVTGAKTIIVTLTGDTFIA